MDQTVVLTEMSILEQRESDVLYLQHTVTLDWPQWKFFGLNAYSKQQKTEPKNKLKYKSINMDIGREREAVAVNVFKLFSRLSGVASLVLNRDTR